MFSQRFKLFKVTASMLNASQTEIFQDLMLSSLFTSFLLKIPDLQANFRAFNTQNSQAATPPTGRQLKVKGSEDGHLCVLFFSWGERKHFIFGSN
jgi:hypothetical protein